MSIEADECLVTSLKGCIVYESFKDYFLKGEVVLVLHAINGLTSINNTEEVWNEP